MTFGRHHQQLGVKAWPVFDALQITTKRLVQKDLYAGLKLLPSLVRCLLIHGNYLLFLNGSLRNPGFGSTEIAVLHPGKDKGSPFYDQIILYGF
jgi:hypothetical protein